MQYLKLTEPPVTEFVSHIYMNMDPKLLEYQKFWKVPGLDQKPMYNRGKKPSYIELDFKILNSMQSSNFELTRVQK